MTVRPSMYQTERGHAPIGPASRGAGPVRRAASRLFGALSLALVLALIVTVPVLQFYTLGYMMRAAGRVAKTGRIRDGFTGVREASKIGQTMLGAFIVSLPSQLFASLREDAALIAPGERPAQLVGILEEVFTGLAVVLIVLAVSQGGGLVHFFRPLRALRRLVTSARQPKFAERTGDGIVAFVHAFAFKQSMVLGLRCYLAAGIVLAVPTGLLALSGRTGVMAFMSAGLLAMVVVYVPFLQLNVAIDNDLRAGFQFSRVRDAFERAPLAFLFAFTTTTLLALPLYLLKIEIIPRDALWLPSLLFVLTIFPTKLAAAWAYHRGANRSKPHHGVWRWTARTLLVPPAALYALIVYLSPVIGWHGVLGMFEHHAYLLPVPF